MRTWSGTQLTVTSSEFWLTEINAGRAYTFGADLAASPGNFSEVQLLNPAASGKQATIRSIIAGTSVNGNIEIRRFDTGLATDVAPVANLLLGGANGVCHVRTNIPAARDGTLLNTIRVTAGQPIYPVPDWWASLGQGIGIVLCPDSANVGISVTFNLREL